MESMGWALRRRIGLFPKELPEARNNEARNRKCSGLELGKPKARSAIERGMGSVTLYRATATYCAPESLLITFKTILVRAPSSS